MSVTIIMAKKFSMMLPMFLFGMILLAKPASALTISPSEKEYNVNPGDMVIEVIQLQNESAVPITIYPFAENFVGKGEGAGAEFYPAGEDPYGTAMADWVTIGEEHQKIMLEPGKRHNITFTVQVPEDATPGGHYGTVVLSSAPKEGAGQETAGLGVNRQISFMMLYRVSGDIKESGGLTEFGFANPRPWYNHLPIDFFMRFENNGNVHLRPVGTLFVKDMFGRQVAQIPVNDSGRAVLPRSIRRFEFSWEKGASAENESGLTKEIENFGFGKYTASLVMTYGYDMKTVTQTATFFVWPWRLMTIAGGGLLILIIAFMLLGKLYNRAVIEGYKRQLEREKKK